MRCLSTLALFCLLSGCDSQPHLLGFGQPFIVQQAVLKRGDLPGAAPASDGEGAQPAVTSLQLGFGTIRPGASNLRLRGRTSGDAYAVGMALLERGGYWVQPVGSEDPTTPGELEYEFAFDAASELEPGRYTLAVVAFDEHGHAGSQLQVQVCVASSLPDNLNACNPESKPPPAIVSLRWNADADLDLIVEAPNGRRIDRGNRLLLQDDVELARLDADGVTGCLLDGRRYENLVFNEPPAEGSTWLAYANLFDACDKPAVSFTLTVYRSYANADGTFELRADEPIGGELVRIQANGGAGQPLYLAAIQF